MDTEIEDRLRRAFSALASTVDSVDTVDMEAAPAARPRRRLTPVFAAATAVVLVAAGVVFAVTRPTPGPVPVTPATAASPSASARSFSFDLLTHCGVDEAKIGGTYFEAEHPIVGPAVSAPAGWDNPYQRGTMTLLSPDTAVFHDDHGHEVRFRARPGATAFKLLCD
ncbi:hypothetical protein [Amycolatopsis sp. NPDC051128]|uniref:hypothetical protein n=1 Tax=Amycolatopsis sp. NPDC051128 TaxID=3155412 RepID=UPI003449FB86